MVGSEKYDKNDLELLINQAISGERIAQNRIYEMLAPRMFPVCLRYSNNRDEAEEILQESFIKMFTHLKQYRKDGAFEGWLRKIVVNTALQKLREKARMYPVVTIKEETIEVPHMATNETFANIGYKVLLELIQKLPPAYRMVFNLYVFEGMKHKEIAEQLQISEGTSKSNLYDARMILQKEIHKLEYSPSKTASL